MNARISKAMKTSDASLSLIARNLLAGQYSSKAELLKVEASVKNAMANSEKAFAVIMKPTTAGRKGLAEISTEEFDTIASEIAQTQVKAHILAQVIKAELEQYEDEVEPTDDIQEVTFEEEVPATEEVVEETLTEEPTEVQEETVEETPETTEELPTEEPTEVQEEKEAETAADDTPEADEAVEELVEKELEELTPLDDLDEEEDTIASFFEEDEIEEEPTTASKKQTMKKATASINTKVSMLEGLFDFKN